MTDTIESLRAQHAELGRRIEAPDTVHVDRPGARLVRGRAY